MSSKSDNSPPLLSPATSLSDDATTNHAHDKPIKLLRFSNSGKEKYQEASSMGSTSKDIEGKTLPKATNSDSRSDKALKKPAEAHTTPVKSNIKGTCAKFLRQNPRFVNEPICQVLPNESSVSVGDCLSWKCSMDSVSTVATTIHERNEKPARPSKACSNELYNSTCQSTYLPPANDQRPHPLQKHHPFPKVDGIAPLINEQTVVMKERISYAHQYNCRTDPNEPIRGKLHGSFVWEPQETIYTSQTVQSTTQQ